MVRRVRRLATLNVREHEPTTRPKTASSCGSGSGAGLGWAGLGLFWDNRLSRPARNPQVPALCLANRRRSRWAPFCGPVQNL